MHGSSAVRAARARGRLGGRKREMTGEKVKLASRLMADPSVTVKEICGTLGVSRSTLYRYVGPQGQIRSGS
jgi:DNA invertase Pin-like site-specific DNA recombinase